MRYILLVLCLFTTSCGTFVTNRQKDVAAQGLSDMKAAKEYIGNSYENTPASWAADAMYEHGVNMAKAMEIDPDDLPKARVNHRQWQMDPEGARIESNENAKQDSTDIGTYALWGLSGASIAIIAGRLGMMILANHPIGMILGQLGTIFGGESPTKQKVFSKMVAVLDEYKKLDPDWRNNKLYMMLSDAFTQTEKDFIKDNRHG